MIEDAFDCRAALNDTCDDHSELADLKLTAEHWNQLEDIRTMLKPFWEYTEYVSREQPSIQLTGQMYVQLESILKQISRREGPFSHFDNDIITAVNVGKEKFMKYKQLMEGNDIYYLATILDPRIKTQWIKDHIDNADEVIQRIRTFLKATYPPEPELPANEQNDIYKSLEYRFMLPYQAESTVEDFDIDSYLNTPRIKYKNKPQDDQTKWLLSWWNANKMEFPCMAQAARDYLCVPASEVDIERLFNVGRDILGIRRFSMSGETLRTMILLKDALRMQESRQK
jgi:hypothetical protein